MMRQILLVLLIAGACGGCLDMDGFLANEAEVEAYRLPGNTIPEHLIDEVALDSEGHTLYGYWVASNGERPGLTILYSHGNKHHIDEYWDRVMLLHALGGNVFIYSYRGFGRSEGTFSEAAMLADARAAVDFVRTHPDVNADSVGFYGYSLGNVASIYQAAELMDPLFLVAESPFASANSLIQASTGLPLPAGWLTTGSFDNAARIRRVQTPVLVIHGRDDDFVRLRDNGKVVFERAPEPKMNRWIDGARHNDIPAVMGEERYLALLEEWIRFASTYAASE